MSENNNFLARRAAQLRKEGKPELAIPLERVSASRVGAFDVEADSMTADQYRAAAEHAAAKKRREYLESITPEERSLYSALLRRIAMIHTVLVQLQRNTQYTPNIETLQTRRDLVNTMTDSELYQEIMSCSDGELESMVRRRPMMHEALIRICQERGEEKVTRAMYEGGTQEE